MVFCDEYFPPIKFYNGIVKKMLRGKIAWTSLLVTSFLQDFLSHKIAELVKEYLREINFSPELAYAKSLQRIISMIFKFAIDRIRMRTVFGVVAFIQPVGTYLPQLRLQRYCRFVQHVSVTHPSNSVKQIQRNWVSL